MAMISVSEAARKWGISEPLVRKFCREDRIPEAEFLYGVWFIPDDAPLPTNGGNANSTPPLLRRMLRQQRTGRGGIYDYLQTNLAYSSNRMASNRLTLNQVEFLYNKDKVLVTNEKMKLNDFIETRNHFICVNFVLDNAMKKLKPNFFTKLHSTLFSDLCGHRHKAQATGTYRTSYPPFKTGLNISPDQIGAALTAMCQEYEAKKSVSLQDILDLHVLFERIRPFEDGNGRIGRLLMLKECLRHDFTPIIIDDKHRSDYLNGIAQWDTDRLPFLELCMTAQSHFQAHQELDHLLEMHARMMRE